MARETETDAEQANPPTQPLDMSRVLRASRVSSQSDGRTLHGGATRPAERQQGRA